MDSAAPISPTPSQRSAHFSSTVTSTETPLAALAEQHVNTWPELVFGKIRGQGLDGISRTNAEYGNCLGDGLKRAQRPLKEATFQLKSETFDANPIKHLLYQDTQPDVQHGRNPLIEVSEAVANNLNDVRNNTQRLVWTGGR
ncbi:hypothetical protein C4K03_4721 [Pseudomonas synxantha]|uniref:Uncharacterized protein n=1 Tax=Pseudomonas synxantha TaxID=47883 RepID=A0A3G7UE14_9PSED|nr:hypothetical protein [Pseudomonas synxantha]AZE56859.1 hypothetical protein C4K03_4721 [Pseudomonas synxantha]